MEKSISIRFYLNFQKTTHGNLTPIYCRIIHLRAKLEKDTGIKLVDDDWDSTLQRSKTDENVNNTLNALKYSIEEFQLILSQQNKPFSFSKLRSFLNNESPTLIQVLSFFKDFMKEARENKTLQSQRLIKFNAVCNSLSEFIIRNFKLEDLDFDQINYDFITKYHAFLNIRKSQNTNLLLQPNTVSNYHKIFKQVLNEAYKLQYLKSNPYKLFTIKWTKTNRECLSLSELKKLEQFDFGDNESLSNVRYMFLFSAYSGIRFSDAQKLPLFFLRTELI